jgi:flagellum-specific peptidoglycan hydrolase FlgJ
LVHLESALGHVRQIEVREKHILGGPSTRKRRRSTRRRTSKRLRLQLAIAAGGLTLLVAGGVSRAASLPPLVASHPPPVATARPTLEQTRFINRIGKVAQRYQTLVELPPSLITAMAINETGWGSSELSTRANNYFGIKAEVGEGTAGRVLYDTQEVIDGRVVLVRANFRAYRSLDESVQDLGTFLHQNSRYDALWARAGDPRASAVLLARAGYATDPDWPDKLIGLIDSFGLESLDIPPWLVWFTPLAGRTEGGR